MCVCVCGTDSSKLGPGLTTPQRPTPQTPVVVSGLSFTPLPATSTVQVTTHCPRLHAHSCMFARMSVDLVLYRRLRDSLHVHLLACVVVPVSQQSRCT
jgi:hypothetical protein